MWKVVIALLLGVSSLARAQFVGGVVTGAARAQLSQSWNKAGPNERLFCVSHWAITLDGVVHVMRVQEAKRLKATPYYLEGVCPLDNMPTVHTHTPYTCDILGRNPDGTDVSGKCRAGGIDAWVCFPSQLDRDELVRTKLPFGVVQCSKHAFVFYFNAAWTPDTTK